MPTKIQWTQEVWNPTTGCTKISPGCKNCYAERMSARLKSMGAKNYSKGFEIATHPHMLDKPLNWKRPRKIFVNSMSDLFHKKVPTSFIKEIFVMMREASWHTFQILTKRSERLYELNAFGCPDNVWIGVSVENMDFQYRIEHLRNSIAKIKFLSCEPLLGPIPNMNLDGIDWVIVGGESGPHAREMRPEWALDIRDQCIKTSMPFFFKQWGGSENKKLGRNLGGREWSEMPGHSFGW